jgi:hypothetical protein
MITIKHPYSWAWSYIRVHREWLGEFRLRWQENPYGATAEACEMWNTRNKLWLKHPARYSTVVRHEDLLEDFEETMRRIGRDLQLPPVQEFGNIEHKLTPRDTISEEKFKAHLYRNRHFIWRLGRELVKVVDTNIDWDFAGELGYHRLNLKELW